ncbi:hypothetical protein [Streptomyces sp. SAJ15]|uniref:hypothetical protein n=1 Tax=Streptomyces sp. SAJ15 TaxID=2011095 RepID=UPI001185D3C6|nr:hypothetical protein [Streptomyces sp. SAJ15]TVL92822.1 hypothetical protein CD790_06590 [Streptomyces sp. SAJ15]
MALRLLRGKDGRLTAYAPVAGGIARWTETEPGGPDWDGPQVFEAPGLSDICVAQGRDGYVHLVGLRRRPVGDERTDLEVVHATQYQTGRPMTAWHSLSTPYPKDWRKALRIGPPSAAVDANGALYVFIRNAGHGVCARRQDAKGNWGPWEDLKGRDVRDGLCATATGDGRVELLATTGEGALRWYQPEPGARLRRGDDVPARPRPDSVSAVESSRDTVTHYWRDAMTGAVLAYRPDGDDAVSLGGEAGTGPVAVARAEIAGHDCTVLAHREAKSGRLAVAAHPTEHESAGVWWTPTGDPGTGAPALAVDGVGRLVVATLSADGALHVARQKRSEPGLALGGWRRA